MIGCYQYPDNYQFLYSDFFEGLGCITDVSDYIKVDNNTQLIVHPTRKIPVALHPKVQQELKCIEELDVIEKVKEPTDWVNSIVSSGSALIHMI